MGYEWKCSVERLDWNELSELYKSAPLGEKKPEDLQRAFGASMVKCIVYSTANLSQ